MSYFLSILSKKNFSILFLGLSLWGTALSQEDSQQTSPKIYNGNTSFSFPSVGALLKKDGNYLSLICSGTLIGPTTFLTASHCFCGDSLPCETDKDDYTVFFMKQGITVIKSIEVAEGFNFPENDYAVVNLESPTFGIMPSKLAEDIPESHSSATIVGFGNINDYYDGAGIKRQGQIKTRSCSSLGFINDDSYICWITNSFSEGANTCPGDSGGPLFSVGGALAGITSGGIGQCDWNDFSFNQAVAPYKNLISDMSLHVLSLSKQGERIKSSSTIENELSPINSEYGQQIVIEENTKHFIVTTNAEVGFSQYSLSVSKQDYSESEYNCNSNFGGSIQSCVIINPPPGVWDISYNLLYGQGGKFQLSASSFVHDCSLDIDGNGSFDALTDGILLIRYLLGYREETLVEGAISEPALRSSALDIPEFLGSTDCMNSFDIDGDGELNALTDGILVLRYLLGFRGEILIGDAQGMNSSRRTHTEITDWLDSLMK